MRALDRKNRIFQTSQAPDSPVRLALGGAAELPLGGVADRAVQNTKNRIRRSLKELLPDRPPPKAPPGSQPRRLPLLPNPPLRYPLPPNPTPPSPANTTLRYTLTDPAMTDPPGARTEEAFGVEYRGRRRGSDGAGRQAMIRDMTRAINLDE